MDYKNALKLAKKSVRAAQKQVEIATDVLNEFTSDNARAIWRIISDFQNLLFTLHYDIMDKFEEHEA